MGVEIQQKIHCGTSEDATRGLLSPIRTYILVVCVFRFLLRAFEKIVVQFWKGFESRWDNSASLFQDRETPPIHTLCANGFSVGVEGDNFIIVKLIDVSGC